MGVLKRPGAGTPRPAFQDGKAMSTYETETQEGTEPRTERALTEYMSVLPDGGDVFTVVGQNGGTYRVDRREGRCTCPDYEYRDIRCKHLRRVDFATGEEPVPLGVDGVDPQLGEHTDGGPKIPATDGGVLEAGDGGEVLEEHTTEERPDECDCGVWNAEGELPCWPCYREGFDDPASVDRVKYFYPR